MADIDKLVEELSGITLLEAADLVKALEDKLGVSAAAPVAVAAAGGGGGDAAPAAEKTEFDVILAEIGGNKISVIKETRGCVAGLGLAQDGSGNLDVQTSGAIKIASDKLGIGLADAKKLVESAPCPLKEGVSKEEAEEIKTKMEAAGAKIEIK